MTGLRQVMQGECAMILPSSAIFHLEEKSLLKSMQIINPDMTRQALITTNSSITQSDASLWVIDMIKRVTAAEQKFKHWRGKLKGIQKALVI